MEKRLLIYAPSGQDAALACKMLTMAGVDCVVAASVAQLASEMARGVGAVLTVEEALPGGVMTCVADFIAHQPAWSDLPLVLLTHRGPDSLAVRTAVASLGNVTLLERPVRTLTLITSLQSVLRARAKQYQVRETDRRKDEFLASLGHELRNPLAPIRTSMTLLNQLYPGQAPVKRVSDVVERQVCHLTRLVDDLLDVARINSGKIALQRQHTTLAAVLGHVSELCAAAAAAKRIHLVVDAPARPVALVADYARVVQIVANIVSNAVKFTPPDGRITIAAEADARTLRIRVRDSGIGLDAAACERIFEMFEQSRQPSGQIASGLGIGLSLSRQFAEMHGGDVHATSEGLGKGSEFVVTLPIVESIDADTVNVGAQAAPGRPARDRVADAGAAGIDTINRDAPSAPVADTAPPDAAAPARRAQVLVVDDNRDAADSLQALFEIEHCDVTTVYDGYEAVHAVEAAMPDVIVMDLGMPGMDGYEAARNIRAKHGAQNVLMIALTGWGQSDARQRTLDAGFNHHLVKPVSFDELRRLTGAALATPL
jgi:signal transduction histidine kinase